MRSQSTEDPGGIVISLGIGSSFTFVREGLLCRYNCSRINWILFFYVLPCYWRFWLCQMSLWEVNECLFLVVVVETGLHTVAKAGLELTLEQDWYWTPDTSSCLSLQSHTMHVQPVHDAKLYFWGTSCEVGQGGEGKCSQHSSSFCWDWWVFAISKYVTGCHFLIPTFHLYQQQFPFVNI